MHARISRYARTGRETRTAFDTFTRSYLTARETLAMVLLLVDCSIPPQDVDLQYAAWLASAGVPFSLVFTKADKRKKGVPRRDVNVAAFKAALLDTHGFTSIPPSIITSAANGLGKGELLAFVASLRVLAQSAS
jgi:GTP-binding protein